MNIKTPDVSEIYLMELQERPFPFRIDFRITISDEAYETIYTHAKESTAVEICGVLIGDVLKDTHGPYLDITDAIKGEHAKNQAGEVTFTHETWSYIIDIKDSKFHDKRVVGWYHSHPKFGIFLSQQDVFIHTNFFKEPWQVAFVVDPVSEEEGFFVWYNGKPIRIEQYWINGNKKTVSEGITNSEKMKINDLGDTFKTAPRYTKRRIQPFHVLIGLLIITSLLVTYLIRNDFNIINKFLSPQNHYSSIRYAKTEGIEKNLAQIDSNINTLLTSQKQHLLDYAKIGEIEKNLARIDGNIYGLLASQKQHPLDYAKTDEIKKSLAQNKLLSDLDIKITPKGNHVWCTGKVYTQHHKELVAKVIGSVKDVESVDLREIVVTNRYITSEGESLSKIATKVYGNPERWRDILQANREKLKGLYGWWNIFKLKYKKIKYSHKIQPFTTLILPE